MVFEEIRIENTNMCVFDCWMCPRSKMTRPQGVMPAADFKEIYKMCASFMTSGQVRWLDLNGYGEPLLDPSLPEKISFSKEKYPSVAVRMVTSGYNLSQQVARELVHLVVDKVVISHYGGTPHAYQSIHGVDLFEETRKNIEGFVRQNYEAGQPIAIEFEAIDFQGFVSDVDARSLASWHQAMAQFGVCIRPARRLHNWGDSFSFSQPSPTVCSVVAGFRSRVLQITWQGDVIPCCFDYDATVNYGNLLSAGSVETVFRSEAHERFIRSHTAGDLADYPVCSCCDKCQLP